MELPVKNTDKMEKKEESDEEADDEYEYYDDEYYDDEGSGSGDGEEGSGDTDIESRVFNGGRMSLGRGGMFPGNRRRFGMNMMNTNRAMVGRGGGLRNRQGMLNRRQGLVTNRNTGSRLSLVSQAVDDYKEDDYEEYLEDEAFSTADSAVDATDSKYDYGLESLGGAAAGANRRIGIDSGGNRGQGLYGADRQGYGGGFGKFNAFQNFGVGSGFNGMGDTGSVIGNGRRFGGYGGGGGAGAGYNNFNSFGGGPGAAGGLRAGYQGLGGGGAQTQGGYQGGRAGAAGGLGGGGGLGQGGGLGGGGGGLGQGGYLGQGGAAGGGAMSRDYGYNDYGGGFGGGYGGGYGGGGYGGGGGGYEDQLVLLRPPASSKNRGGLGSISELIDIDYETLVLLLGVAGAGASWVLYQTILTKGRRSFKQLKKEEQQENVLDKVADFLNFGN